MPSTRLGVRLFLIAIAGMLAACLSHIVIDVAGDYLLPHDAYDGIEHYSRGLLLATVAIVLVAAAIRTVFEILDRKPDSTSSPQRMHEALGHRMHFTVAVAVVAMAALVAMECLDCALNGQLAGIKDLFGGSLLLGLSTVLLSGAACGWLVHRLIAWVARYEAPFAAFLTAVLTLRFAAGILPTLRNRTRASIPGSRSLLLSKRGQKRGPPVPIFG